jgi:hypothetical protein
LTTTLEVLGNILFMRDDIQEAKSSLERACPLMELLPASVNDDHRFAVGCFALLREVYGKLYSIRDAGERELLGIDSDGNDDNDGYSSLIDDDTDIVRDIEKDRDRFFEEDEGGRRRGRRRRRKRGQANSLSQSALSNSGGMGSGHSNLDSDRDDHDDLALHTSFDVDRRFEDLRSPYDHLRAELQLRQRQESHQNTPQIMYKEGAGLATATADLDALVQRFVFEDNAGRLKLFRMAKDYHEAMTVHMAANPQLVNGLGRDLDIVLVYVEVLSKVNTEGGFDFISKELDMFNLAVAAPDGDGDSARSTDQYPDTGAVYEPDDDDDLSESERGIELDVDDESEDDDIDEDDDYTDEFDDEAMEFSRDQVCIPKCDKQVSEDMGDRRNILSDRLGSINFDRERGRGRSISGAGRIKRHQGGGGAGKTSKSQSQKAIETESRQKDSKSTSKTKYRGKLNAAGSTSKSRILQMLNAEPTSHTGEQGQGQPEQTGRYRSAPLSPAERNRFMVLNAFERALSENYDPLNPHASGDRDGDSGGISGVRGGKKNERLGRDRESIAKIFQSSVAPEDTKVRSRRDSIVTAIITVIVWLFTAVLLVIYLATDRRGKVPPETGTGTGTATANCRSRLSKTLSYGEYFITRLPLPQLFTGLIASWFGIETASSAPYVGEDAAATASNIDDTSSSAPNKKKDGRRSSRGDFRERDAHRLVPAVSVESAGKDGDTKGFFTELQGVLTSIWKELSSSVVPIAMTQNHSATAASSKIKTTGSSSFSHISGIQNGNLSHGTGTNIPSSCAISSPIPKAQNYSKSSNTKKEKVLSNGKSKSGSGSAVASDTPAKKPQGNNGNKSKAISVVVSPVPSVSTIDDSFSVDSDADSDGDTAARIRASDIAAEALKVIPIILVSAIIPAVVDDDAGYSRCVRKGSIHANKSAAAASASAAGNGSNSPRPNPNGSMTQAQRNAAAISSAPVVDAATVAQQRAALQYYETLKEREKARLLAAAKNHHQTPSATPTTPTLPAPAAWSTVPRIGAVPPISKSVTPQPFSPSSKPLPGNGTYPKGGPGSYTYPSGAPKGMTYASVAQNSTSGATLGSYDVSSRSSFNSTGSGPTVSSSARPDIIQAQTQPQLSPITSTNKMRILSNPHSTNNSCPSSPNSHTVRRGSLQGRGIGKGPRAEVAVSVSDASPAQSGQHSAYLRAREQASDQQQQMQLMSDLLSLSVRPEEGITSPPFAPEDFLNGQPQISRSLSSSFDGSRGHLNSQFGGLVGYLPDTEGGREAGRERERELLSGDISDTIGDMDIGAIDLSFALATDVDADTEPNADISEQADALYRSGAAKQQAQLGYEYRGLSQYGNPLSLQAQQLGNENQMHNLYLATGDIDDGSQLYSQSSYGYTDYTPTVAAEDIDRQVPRQRGFSSGSQLDFSAQSQSGLSPNAPSFNPNTMALWRGQMQTSSLPFDHHVQQPHGIALMDADLNMEYPGNLDYSSQIQQQLQHQYYQESLTQQQGYEGHFSPYLTMTHPPQQIPHPLSIYYQQDAEQLHQSQPLPAIADTTAASGTISTVAPISAYAVSPNASFDPVAPSSGRADKG